MQTAKALKLKVQIGQKVAADRPRQSVFARAPGIFAGPAIGATALQMLPDYPNSGAWAVSLALCGGFLGLLLMVRRFRCT